MKIIGDVSDYNTDDVLCAVSVAAIDYVKAMKALRPVLQLLPVDVLNQSELAWDICSELYSDICLLQSKMFEVNHDGL